jgi:hypothetical protein
MAKKAPAAKSTSPVNPEADDLAILHPEISLPIGGEKITIREYGLVEGLRVRALVAPFTSDLVKLFERGPFLTDDVIDLLGLHVDLVMEAVAISVDKPASWVRELGPEEGNLLLMGWWGVHGPFFIRQIASRQAEKFRLAALGGQTSTSSSSAPASERPSK